MQNWVDPRIFLAVLRAGSTLAAARDLGIAQTTVARRIEALEHDLKLTLFHRDTRGFHPTAAARDLQPLAEALERAGAAFYQRAARKRDSELQIIRLTAAEETYRIVGSRLVAEFTERHPEVQFVTNTTGAFLDIGNNEVDVAIRHGRIAASDDVLCRRIGEDDWGLFASQTYIDRHGQPATADDLADHRVVLLDWTGDRLPLLSWLAEHTPKSRVAGLFNAPEGIRAALEDGNVLGPLPDGIAITARTPLVRVLRDAPVSRTPVWLLVSPEAQKRPIVRAFADHVASRASAFVVQYIAARGEPAG